MRFEVTFSACNHNLLPYSLLFEGGTVEHQFPLPGIAVTLLTVTLAWLAGAGIVLMLARSFPNNPISDAINDLFGSGSTSH